MATNGQEHSAHHKVLRKLRPVLVKELPDPAVLLSAAELSTCFTGYEKSQVLSPSLPSERAEKLVEILEFKSYEVYEKLVIVVRRLKPELGVKMEGIEREVSSSSTASCPGSSGGSPERGMSNGYNQNENLVVPIEESGRQPQAMVEDAGPFGLSGHGEGPAYHLKHLSYNGREFLSKHLNGQPPERNVFHNFCRALGVEQRLVQASARSRNPTAYLIQEYSARPEATFNRLERALSQIGRRDLYQQVFVMMGNDDMDEDCN